MRTGKKKPKLLLLGWDAADWKIINSLLDQGLMPNLEKFINDGVIGNLATLGLVNEYERQLQKVKQWAARQPNVEILYVPHRSVLEQPFEQALRINEFLGYELLPELMVQAVDASLYREKEGVASN
ncbi:MAG TPA: hypothetical protein ENJ95_14800 [Bacteroidetes bacterium]|nr:hypothetical protein [Bacteroidota bacterium]